MTKNNHEIKNTDSLPFEFERQLNQEIFISDKKSDNEAQLLEYIQTIQTNSFDMINRNLRGQLLKDYLSTVEKQFTPLQKEVFIGIMLGDGNIQSNGGLNYFFKFDQKAKNSDYVNLVYLIFQQFVGTSPKLRLVKGISHSWWFRTYRLPFLKFYHDQFYALNAHGNSVRMIPKLLHRWITPISLAFWFMDDGSKEKYGYRLHTQCFLLHEVKILQKVLGHKFGLEVSIHSDNKKRTQKTYYYLHISHKSVKQFNSLVESYVIPCMQYKLHHV
jgi:hypothetical protein